MATDIYGIPVTTLEGAATTLASHRGEVLLIVNTASQCGYTPQYEGLEALQRKYHGQGFSVLGFPCNQFMGQEPGTAEDIRQFCSTKYDVTFPLFAKLNVNGSETHPLYLHLKEAAPGILGSEAIKWNFTKFLVTGGLPGLDGAEGYASGEAGHVARNRASCSFKWARTAA
jgi:glutathione peroxidase